MGLLLVGHDTCKQVKEMPWAGETGMCEQVHTCRQGWGGAVALNSEAWADVPDWLLSVAIGLAVDLRQNTDYTAGFSAYRVLAFKVTFIPYFTSIDEGQILANQTAGTVAAHVPRVYTITPYVTIDAHRSSADPDAGCHIQR